MQNVKKIDKKRCKINTERTKAKDDDDDNEKDDNDEDDEKEEETKNKKDKVEDRGEEGCKKHEH